MTSLTLLNTALLAGTGVIGVSLWLNESIQAEAVAMALPLVWQLASTGGWVAWEVSGIFQNLADVKQGMESIAAPNTMVDVTRCENPGDQGRRDRVQADRLRVFQRASAVRAIHIDPGAG